MWQRVNKNILGIQSQFDLNEFEIQWTRRLSRDNLLSPLTLNFDLPEWSLEIVHLLIEENNYAKLFWNPSINIDVLVRSEQIRMDGRTHIHQSDFVRTMSSSLLASLKRGPWWPCITHWLVLGYLFRTLDSEEGLKLVFLTKRFRNISLNKPMLNLLSLAINSTLGL